MALTTRIITHKTPVIATVLVLALLATTWAVVELAPSRTMGPLAPLPSAHRITHASDVTRAAPGSADPSPVDQTACRQAADRIYEHFVPLAEGEDVERHTASIAVLIDDYVERRCASGIHHGDWHVTAQILGVGLIHDVLRPQADVYDASLVWDARAATLVPIAANTFEIREPWAMCDEALRLNESDALSSLHASCLRALQL